MTEAEEIERNNTLLTVSTHLLEGFIGEGLNNAVDYKTMAKDAVQAAQALICEVANTEWPE